MSKKTLARIRRDDTLKDTTALAMETTAPFFSLVIPAYNEEAYLPTLLDTVDVARQHYRRGPDAVEVIVADNASTDRTADLARERGCRVAFVEKRCIAASRNGGAAIAQGELLGFIDADSRIHPETFNAIEDVMATGKVVGGATGLRMERMSPGIAAAYCILVPMTWIVGVDAGVVYCRREDYLAVGGYNEEKLFAEDVEFMLALKTLGARRGQRLRHAKQAKAITSTRKWDTHGEWHYLSLLLRGSLAMLGTRVMQERLARHYWYDVRR